MTIPIKNLVRRFYAELWNQWHDTAVEQVLEENFAFRGSMGAQTSGTGGWRVYRDAIRRGSPDFHNEVVDLVADGDRAAARLRYTGQHRGLLAGIPATGRAFEYSGCRLLHQRRGQVDLGLGTGRP